MSRLLPLSIASSAGALALLVLPAGLFAQAVPSTEPEVAAEFDYPTALPDDLFSRPLANEVSVSLRLLGQSRVSFSQLGNIASNFEDDDPTKLVNRVYADGSVGLDARGQSATGETLSDGMTNTWSYTGAEQIAPGGDGIIMHAYAAQANGAVIQADAPKAVNPDLEYSRLLWQWGRPMSPRRRAWQFGWLGGWGLSDVNAKFRGTTTADLVIMSDTYGLNGAPVPFDYDEDGNPVEGYTAPSTRTIEFTDDDGVTRSYVIDNTTLLGSRPRSRTFETVDDGATIDGFWQVSGAYFTLRSGPWMRWEPVTNLSLKVSGGGTFTLIGLSMNYEETLVIDEDTKSDQVSGKSGVRTETFAGLYGSVDGEWLLNDRTSFFASAYYEDFDEELSLELDGREAAASVASGFGLRFGLTTRF